MLRRLPRSRLSCRLFLPVLLAAAAPTAFAAESRFAVRDGSLALRRESADGRFVVAEATVRRDPFVLSADGRFALVEVAAGKAGAGCPAGGAASALFRDGFEP